MTEKELITLTINDKKVEGLSNETILEIAKKNSIYIPTLCYHSDLENRGKCGVCVVEVKGKKDLVHACSTQAEQGMEILTNSLKVIKEREENIQKIFSQHEKECYDCVWKDKCRILKLVEDYKVKSNPQLAKKEKEPTYQFGNSVVFESFKCIQCGNCLEVCKRQGVNFLEKEEEGESFRVVPSQGKNKDCIYCGQCIMHCPSGAFEGVGEFEDIEKPFKEKDKVVVVQFAPSIRTSLGEEFGLVPGTIVTGKIVSALRELGFDRVFDTCVGADFTTLEESKELIERIEKKENLPMISSCCPAWIRYVELYYPEFIPNLAVVRSPQAILGGLIKTYWAEKENIDPKNIVVVSVMPCVAKKYEISREELNINGIPPVDYVLTTRELSRLLNKKKIDFKELEDEKVDSAFDEPSGGGVIYGASGGVMESAFRTNYEKVSGLKLDKIEFEEIRGMEGVKKAEIKLNDKVFRIAVVNGLGNAKQVLEEIKENPSYYTCIEVMACYGGCIGGGGQPVPTDRYIRSARAGGLYAIDDKKEVRRAQDNVVVQKIYQEFLDKNSQLSNSLLYTSFSPKKKGIIKKM